MKAAVLYSGGKDSSFMAVMLNRLGLDVELCTANFGVYDSYIPASKSATSLGFTHKVLDYVGFFVCEKRAVDVCLALEDKENIVI